MDPTFTMLERVLVAAGKQLQASSTSLPGHPTLAALAGAYDLGKPGTKVDWSRLRGFLDWLALHPNRTEEAIAAPPPRSGTVLDVLLAGMAEHIAALAGVTAPRWTRSVPPLDDPWDPPGTPRMIAEAKQQTPEPFRRRNVVLAESDLWRCRG